MIKRTGDRFIQLIMPVENIVTEKTTDQVMITAIFDDAYPGYVSLEPGYEFREDDHLAFNLEELREMQEFFKEVEFKLSERVKNGNQ